MDDESSREFAAGYVPLRDRPDDAAAVIRPGVNSVTTDAGSLRDEHRRLKETTQRLDEAQAALAADDLAGHRAHVALLHEHIQRLHAHIARLPSQGFAT